MTRKAMNALKGWGIGAGITVTLGTIALLSSSRTAEEKAVEGMYTNEILQENSEDSFVYPTIYDASVITNIPVEDIQEAIRTKSQIDGYYFSVERP